MSMLRTKEILLLWRFSLFITFLVHSCALNPDGALLLSFKYSVLSDPLSVLDNWDYSDQTPCSWTGVTCAQIGTPFGTPEMFRVISLVLPNSHLLGSVPEDLGLIQHLRSLDLSSNFLNGTLPSSLFNASELQVLSLSNNVISGELPEFIGGLKGLQYLNLSENALAGNLPKSLASLQNLTVLSLKSNYFSGSIPSEFQSIEVLDLSSNLFNGSLPLDFGGENLQYLNLSYNTLSGLVSPEFVKKIPANATIDLAFNNLTGEIPQSSALSQQNRESFVGNVDLCGKPLKNLCTIPSTLSTRPNVTTNTSSPAIAVIPKSIDSTPVSNSPGSPLNQTRHGLKPGTIAAIAVGDLAGIGILAMVVLYVYQLKKKRKILTAKEIPDTSVNKEEHTRSVPTCCYLSLTNGGDTSEATESEPDGHEIDKSGIISMENELEQGKYKKETRTLVMVDGETDIELETLLKASAYILGSSGPSIVYKAVLEDGTAFAVRRIGESGVQRLKEFESQVRAIAKLRHPNLVRVRGFYWGEDEKLVIYEYVSNGSLANTGHKRIGSSPCHLSFQVRLKIARGVARGLAYIHEKKQVHGNIKPSNILLTPDMEPIITDFGLDWLLSGKHGYKTDGPARHFGSRRSTCSRDGVNDLPNSGSPYTAPVGFMGCTSPFHAPESLKNLKPNPKWDVYSFGILLLELLTGKVFSDRELSQWATGSVVEDKDRVLRMADAAIRGDVEAREEVTLACFKLGFSCASLVSQKRPSMKDALQVLEKMPFPSLY
ncbi:hypothetical protein RJ640_018712 [Escallonia rubra]|uniref:Protein kinase domain-containing protein n=1 Tax=Escallonia rubra TaxID=112253 RepID=A0AA88UKX9_9ASTE|nr:hypothetical protein RJ640_018712 [Escallonia rubra]